LTSAGRGGQDEKTFSRERKGGREFAGGERGMTSKKKAAMEALLQRGEREADSTKGEPS